MVDVRQNKNKLGSVQIAGKMYTANFSRPFEAYMYATLAQMKPYTRIGQPLLVKIHHFQIEEKMGVNKEISQVTSKLEFIDLSTQKSIGIINVTVQEEAVNATRKHPITILKALEKCLKQFAALNNKFTLSKKTALSTPPKAGLYFSLTEVMLGQAKAPSTPIELVSLFTELERYKLKRKKNRQALKSLYGISDGTNFYLNSRLYSDEPYFIKAKMIGTYFYFEDIIYNGLAQFTLGMVGSMLFEKKSRHHH